MKKILMVMLAAAVFIPASNAGRSHKTTLTSVIVKTTHIELYTTSGTNACPQANRWHLLNTHANFEAMYSGLLSAAHSGADVDIVGTGNCDGEGEEIHWAYVLRP